MMGDAAGDGIMKARGFDGVWLSPPYYGARWAPLLTATDDAPTIFPCAQAPRHIFIFIFLPAAFCFGAGGARCDADNRQEAFYLRAISSPKAGALPGQLVIDER